MGNYQCILCKEEAKKTIVGNDMYLIACRRCGKFKISGSMAASLIPPEKTHILSGVTRGSYEEGKSVKLTSDNLQQLVDSAPVPDGPLEIIDLILLYVCQQATKAGAAVRLGGDDYSVAFAKDGGEFCFLLHSLVGSNLLEQANDSIYRLTIEGWRAVVNRRATAWDSRQAFVAMCFDQSLDSTWEGGVKPALEETGYHPVRVDEIEHSEKVDDKIIAEIRRGGLLVADFSGNRGGVYFEAGFALGLGMPVIWTCREQDTP